MNSKMMVKTVYFQSLFSGKIKIFQNVVCLYVYQAFRGLSFFKKNPNRIVTKSKPGSSEAIVEEIFWAITRFLNCHSSL